MFKKLLVSLILAVSLQFPVLASNDFVNFSWFLPQSEIRNQWNLSFDEDFFNELGKGVSGFIKLNNLVWKFNAYYFDNNLNVITLSYTFDATKNIENQLNAIVAFLLGEFGDDVKLEAEEQKHTSTWNKNDRIITAVYYQRTATYVISIIKK